MTGIIKQAQGQNGAGRPAGRVSRAGGDGYEGLGD
jgi:hypothetical protein